MNNIRQIRLILYRLKRDFGQPLTFTQTTSLDQDVKTGQVTRTERIIRIRRAPILDVAMSRTFSYDLSFIAANKNFTYGGLYDVGTRMIIVDGCDIPKDYTPTLNDSCTHADQVYQLESIEPTVYKLGYIFKAKLLASQTN